MLNTNALRIGLSVVAAGLLLFAGTVQAQSETEDGFGLGVAGESSAALFSDEDALDDGSSDELERSSIWEIIDRGRCRDHGNDNRRCTAVGGTCSDGSISRCQCEIGGRFRNIPNKLCCLALVGSDDHVIGSCRGVPVP